MIHKHFSLDKMKWNVCISPFAIAIAIVMYTSTQAHAGV